MAIVAGGGVITAHAVSGAQTMAFVPVVPCRLVDTRTGIGSSLRASPLNREAAVTFAAHGRQASCDLPVSAAALMANITVVNPVTDGFLVAYSADEASLPVTSNINWVANQPPTGNQAIIDLSPSGMFNVYASSGDVDVVIDVVGYYVPGFAGGNGADGADGTNGTNGVNGPQGPVGATGATGATGPQGPGGSDAARGECTLGQVSLTAGDPIPSNMLVADGRVVMRATYAELFALIGDTYGQGDGVATFNLPNMQPVNGLSYTICFVGFAPPVS